MTWIVWSIICRINYNVSIFVSLCRENRRQRRGVVLSAVRLAEQLDYNYPESAASAFFQFLNFRCSSILLLIPLDFCNDNLSTSFGRSHKRTLVSRLAGKAKFLKQDLVSVEFWIVRGEKLISIEN